MVLAYPDENQDEPKKSTFDDPFFKMEKNIDKALDLIDELLNDRLEKENEPEK